MLTKKRNVLTIAAVIATLAMGGGVGAVALEAHNASAPPRGTVQVVTAAPSGVQYADDAGGGDG